MLFGTDMTQNAGQAIISPHNAALSQTFRWHTLKKEENRSQV